jgi:hypothetical protein
MIEIFKKSANVKLKCPFEKKIYRTTDWLIDADKMIPNSIAISGNASILWEFLTRSNSSSKRILLYRLKLLVEFQK